MKQERIYQAVSLVVASGAAIVWYAIIIAAIIWFVSLLIGA